MLSRLLVLAVCAAMLPVSASGSVFGGTNFSSFLGYPDHDCDKPTEPYKPYRFTDQWQVDQYNAEVETYNWQIRQYVDCIEEYLENAANDIERIQEKAQEAIDDLEG